MEKANRIDWLDAAKAFGIFLIYFAHFGHGAGPFYLWAFSFHVPLFFF
ncbi:MAG: acyltransferase, partial [Parasporobacterium sp.]|nr:acyltransferase [Parasporobacterium sp.]